MNGSVSGTAAAHPQRGASAARLADTVLLPMLTIAVVVAGLRAPVGGGIAPVAAVGFGLAIAWALAGALCAVRGRYPHRELALGALTAAVALTAARLGATGHGPAARDVAALATPLVIAISVHYLLALPDGRLASRARRAGAGLVYAAAVATGVTLVLAHRPPRLQTVAVTWALAVLCGLVAGRFRYLRAAGHDRERMQWLGIGLVLAVTAVLACAVLHLLIGWPGLAVAVALTVAVPLGVAAGETPLARHAARVLVQVLAIGGFTAVVAAAYVVIVFGLGHAPAGPGQRELLGYSMLAAAVAAIGYHVARARFEATATRFVYGAKEAPDEVLRTFGSRMTRAVPMDELLLQLAESLRKTMVLTSAEVYTGSGEVLDRAVSVPELGRKHLLVGERERAVVTRAGVSGSAWASVWLPSLLDGRDTSQLRVAPISHGGELLGLIVAERPPGADAFTAEDDRVLTELARQAGLAFHNSRLDTALQTTLDELRKQADELRASRARIVASGDAERRRVERDLHDGAQQHLVALAVNLRLAQDIIADDPTAGTQMLAQMSEDVQVTIKELRELAHGIYPPLLADAGLPDALRAAAGRCTTPVTVTAEGVGRYPQPVETAVYFCCLEALQNAAKHAPGAHAQVRVWEDSGGLLFSVSDDGPGFDAAKARSGHGFTNMADRLGAIGGTVRWESRPGHGSVISGSVPVC